MKKRGIIVIGFIGHTFGILMIGGSKWLPFVEGYEFEFVIIGFCFLGAFGGLISIPILPELMEVYEEDEKL